MGIDRLRYTASNTQSQTLSCAYTTDVHREVQHEYIPCIFRCRLTLYSFSRFVRSFVRFLPLFILASTHSRPPTIFSRRGGLPSSSPPLSLALFIVLFCTFIFCFFISVSFFVRRSSRSFSRGNLRPHDHKPPDVKSSW